MSSYQIDFQSDNDNKIKYSQNYVTSSVNLGFGDTWNSFVINTPDYAASNPYLNNLHDSTGTQTSVDLKIIGSVAAYNTGEGDYFNYAKEGSYNAESPLSLLGDHLWFSQGNGTSNEIKIIFEGLDAGTYDLTSFVNYTDHDPIRTYEFTVNGETARVESQGIKKNAAVSANYVSYDANSGTIEDIVVGSDGKLTISYVGVPGPDGKMDPSIAGLLLTQVDSSTPELPPNSDVLSFNGEFTVETWVRFDKGNPIDNYDGLVASGTMGAGNDLNFYDGRLRLFSDPDDSRGFDVAISQTRIVPDEWVHLAVTRSADDKVRIYVNGELDTVSDVWTDTFLVDRICESLLGQTEGDFSNFGIWSESRSLQEINVTMENGLNANSAGLELSRYIETPPTTGIIDPVDPIGPGPNPLPSESGSENHVLVSGSEKISIDGLALDGAFTFETWVNFDEGNIISNTDGLLSGGELRSGFDINFYDGNIRLFYNEPGQAGKDYLISDTVVQAGEWTHIAVTRAENGQLGVYVNGIKDTGYSAILDKTLVADTLFGSLLGGSEAKFDNTILWSEERSQAEIQSTMSSTNISVESSMIFGHSFEEAYNPWQNQLLVDNFYDYI